MKKTSFLHYGMVIGTIFTFLVIRIDRNCEIEDYACKHMLLQVTKIVLEQALLRVPYKCKWLK